MQDTLRYRPVTALICRRAAKGGAQDCSSIRRKATRASTAVCSGTRMTLRGRPASSSSRVMASCSGSIRNIVEHMQTKGDMNSTVLPSLRTSSASRVTRLISVPTSHWLPGSAALEAAGLMPEESEITMIPENTIEVSGEEAEKLLRLIEFLEENDDVQNVYANYELSEAEMARLEEAAAS